MKRKIAASLALVAEAMTEVVRKRATLARAAFLPIMGILLLSLLIGELEQSLFAQLLLALVSLPLSAIFATTIHRVVLLGEDAIPNPLGIYWTERESRFLLWFIGIWLLYYALWLPSSIIFAFLNNVLADWHLTWLATFLTYLLVAYFEGRFSLVLPATAIDRRSDYKQSWAMSHGRGMMIAFALVIPATILIPVEFVLYNASDGAIQPIVDLIWLLIVIPIFAIEIAIISLAYKKLA